MSAITGTGHAAPRTVGETPIPAAGAAAVSAGIATSAGALYSSFGAALFPSGATGLRAPRNVEDAAILLAEVALATDAARRAASDARITGAAASVQGGLGSAAVLIATANDALYGFDASGGGLVDRRVAASTEKDAAVAREIHLGRQISQLEGKVATLNGEIATENAQANAKIATLTAAKDAKTAVLAPLKDGIAAALAAKDTNAVAALQAKLAAVETEITKLTGEIGTTREAADARIVDLSVRRDAARTELGQARTERATVQATVTALTTQIADFDVAIAVAEQDLSLGRAALVIAFAQMTALVQDSGGDRARETVRSTEIDRNLDETGEALKDLQTLLLARFEADARVSEDLRDARASARVLAAVLGLATALVEVTNVLRRETASSPDEAADAETRARRRQFAL